MPDVAVRWRPSLNIQRSRPDALRRNWLDEASFAPDAYREQQGLSALTPTTRSAALQQYGGELPLYPQAADYFNQGRPQMNAEPVKPLAALGAPGFRQQADDAAFADQISGLLLGQAPVASNPYDQFASALSAAPLARLGAGSRGR